MKLLIPQHPVLLSLLIGSLLLLGVLLDTAGAQAQATSPHSLQITTTSTSILQVEVDGVTVYNGTLAAQETRQWQGAEISLTIEARTPATIIYDGVLQGTTAQTQKRVTLHWPTTAATPPRAAQRYQVQAGDTLFTIAQRFGTDVDTLLRVNQLKSGDLIYAGSTLLIPGSDGSLPPQPIVGQLIPMSGNAPAPVFRGAVTARLTAAAQTAPTDSPFYQTTWLTYYGRPAVPVMGILGEYAIGDLVPLLKAEAAAYDQANGDELAVLPAFHLVYGMATKAPGADSSHLAFLEDTVVEEYIARATEEGFAVILDIQVGALTPADALAYGFPWLSYANVHLALDPEFAMAHAGQRWPGDPIGYVTAAQINAAQAAMQQYITENNVEGQRVLLVHQFLDTMIENKSDLDWSYARLALTLSADGWGGPWGKITKYNTFMDAQTRFTAFKLFYRWDEPLMTPREALGVDGYGEGAFIEVTPNLVIYQ